VTAPENASTDAVVRCPLCNEEYPLDEALRGVPPMLIVVGAGKSVLASDGDDGIRLAPTETAKPFVFEERAAPTKITARPRPPQREKNPLVEIIKVVAGGVVGLSIGQLLLWWVVPGLQMGQRDPFGLAPKLAPYVPWIIPEGLRPLDEDALVQREREQAARRRRPNVTERPAEKQKSPTNSAEKTIIPQTTLTEIPDTTLEPQDDGPNDSPRVTPPSLGIANAPQVAADEVNAALAQAQVSWEERTSTMEIGELKTALEQLARAITFADPADEEIQGTAEAATSLLREIAADTGQLEKLVSVTKPSAAKDKFPGRFIAGEVEQIDKFGRLYSSRVKTHNGNVVIISVVDPLQSISEGDQVLILGVHVDKPMQQLIGLDGRLLSQSVVFGGLALKAPHPRVEASTNDEQPLESDERPPAPPLEGDTQDTQ